MSIPEFSVIPNSVTNPDTFNEDMDQFLSELNPVIEAWNESIAAATALAAGGAVSLKYIVDALSTANSDPGPGKLRFDNATQTSSNTLRADLTGTEGADYTGLLGLLDDSTSATKGILTIRHQTDAEVWATFAVTALATPGGYVNITVASGIGSSATPFADGDPVFLDFTPKGDEGDQGATGADSLPVAAAGGSVDAITATFAPALTLTDKQACRVVLAGANATTTPTFAPNGLTARTIVKKGGSALAIGDLPGANAVAILQYDATNTRWELLNPATVGNEFFNVAGPASSAKTYTFPNENMEVGFRGIPQESKSGNYTLVLTDAARHIFHPSSDNNARTFTIPANSSVAFPIGTAITFVNMAATACSIAITTDTLTMSPSGSTGTRTLAQYGTATALKITSTQWLISGSGLT